MNTLVHRNSLKITRTAELFLCAVPAETLSKGYQNSIFETVDRRLDSDSSFETCAADDGQPAGRGAARGAHPI